MDQQAYSDFATLRAELMRDYNPQNTQERLLVMEVANSWRRLDEARRRERLFFDLQKTVHAVRSGEAADAFKRDGAEVIMWLDKPHKAFDQVLRAIRDAELAFDRAIRRIEAVVDRRLRRARQMPVSNRPASNPGADAASSGEGGGQLVSIGTHSAQTRRDRQSARSRARPAA